MKLKLYDQIKFTQGDRVEYGFVSGLWGANGIFCRYWVNGQPGKLRTLANSERTYPEDLVRYKSVPKETIEKVVKRLKSNPEKYGPIGGDNKWLG